MPFRLDVPWGPFRRPRAQLHRVDAAIRPVDRSSSGARLRLLAAEVELEAWVHWLDALMVRFEPGAILSLCPTAGGLDLAGIRIAE